MKENPNQQWQCKERWLPLGHCGEALRLGVSASVNDD